MAHRAFTGCDVWPPIALLTRRPNVEPKLTVATVFSTASKERYITTPMKWVRMCVSLYNYSRIDYDRCI